MEMVNEEMKKKNCQTEISAIRTARTKLCNAISVIDLLMKNENYDPALYAVWWMLNEIKDQELGRVMDALCQYDMFQSEAETERDLDA